MGRQGGKSLFGFKTALRRANAATANYSRLVEILGTHQVRLDNG